MSRATARPPSFPARNSAAGDQLERVPGAACRRRVSTDAPAVVRRGPRSVGDVVGFLPARRLRRALREQLADPGARLHPRSPRGLPARSGRDVADGQDARRRAGLPETLVVSAARRRRGRPPARPRSAPVDLRTWIPPAASDRDDDRQRRLEHLLAEVRLAREAERPRARSRPRSSGAGQPRNAATSRGTCHVSESSALRPQRTRSTPSLRRRARASARCRACPRPRTRDRRGGSPGRPRAPVPRAAPPRPAAGPSTSRRPRRPAPRRSTASGRRTGRTG